MDSPATDHIPPAPNIIETPDSSNGSSNSRLGAEHCAECLRLESERWGRTWVEIDLAALRRNARRIANRLPEGGQLIMPDRKGSYEYGLLPEGGRLIISAKKDAYGHGLIAVTRALTDFPFVGAVGVATVEEAIALRENGCLLPIISFSVLEGEALAEAIRREITLTITSLADAQLADQAAADQGRCALAHLKVDTGMGRLGLTVDEIAEQIPAIQTLPKLWIQAVYSHLSNAWCDPQGAREQCRRMEEFRRRAGLQNYLCHWGGSDALILSELQSPNTWLRSGIALYGDHPSIPDLEPVMTFKSRVVYRRRVPAGTAISYGSTFRTTRPTELALIGAGYGNGLPRALSGRWWVLLRGARCPFLGRVCMDQIVVDVTEVPSVSTGEEAVLFGRQGETILSAAEAARQAGTISYELFCLAGQLNPRVYLKGQP